MKNKNIFYMMAVVLFLAFAGCTKDDNTDPGSDDPRDVYTGGWSVQETWTKLAYEVTISIDPNSKDGVFIYNFANLGSSGTPAAATVSGNSIVLDAGQVIDGVKISGAGSLSGSKINWNYTLEDGATLIQAIATYTKR